MTARKESDESWFLYLIETSKGALYCGVTTDVERRFKEHSAGGVRGARALKGKGPLTLRYQVRAGDRSAALKAEYRVKQLSKRDKLALISGSADIEVRVGLRTSGL
ncbi:MAG: GIY-YIG nuclease family protein [Thalassolituus sp.]